MSLALLCPCLLLIYLLSIIFIGYNQESPANFMKSSASNFLHFLKTKFLHHKSDQLQLDISLINKKQKKETIIRLLQKIQDINFQNQITE